MPQRGDDSSSQPVDLLPWVPGGVPPCVEKIVIAFGNK